jgi:hypothetical protein
MAVTVVAMNEVVDSHHQVTNAAKHVQADGPAGDDMLNLCTWLVAKSISSSPPTVLRRKGPRYRTGSASIPPDHQATAVVIKNRRYYQVIQGTLH